MPVESLRLEISLMVYDREDELPPAYRALLRHAEEATSQAYAPYSRFLVGAALLLENGEVVKGANQENAAYPSGLCAERTAAYWAGANHPDQKIVAIAIAARPADRLLFLAVTPCGACRQALSEYEDRQRQPIPMIMRGLGQKIYVTASIADLLPVKFSADNLREV